MQPFVLVRLKQATPVTFAAGRVLGHHSQFGNLHALPLLPALRLIERGEAKLLPHFKRHILREQVEALAARTRP